MVKRLDKFGLKVDEKLANFIDNEVLSETNISSDVFWQNFSDYVSVLTLKNKSLLEKEMLLNQNLIIGIKIKKIKLITLSTTSI